jgi:hypothetical protein
MNAQCKKQLPVETCPSERESRVRPVRKRNPYSLPQQRLPDVTKTERYLTKQSSDVGEQKDWRNVENGRTYCMSQAITHREVTDQNKREIFRMRPLQIYNYELIL